MHLKATECNDPIWKTPLRLPVTKEKGRVPWRQVTYWISKVVLPGLKLLTDISGYGNVASRHLGARISLTSLEPKRLSRKWAWLEMNWKMKGWNSYVKDLRIQKRNSGPFGKYLLASFPEALSKGCLLIIPSNATKHDGSITRDGQQGIQSSVFHDPST